MTELWILWQLFLIRISTQQDSIQSGAKPPHSITNSQGTALKKTYGHPVDYEYIVNIRNRAPCALIRTRQNTTQSLVETPQK